MSGSGIEPEPACDSVLVIFSARLFAFSSTDEVDIISFSGIFRLINCSHPRCDIRSAEQSKYYKRSVAI